MFALRCDGRILDQEGQQAAYFPDAIFACTIRGDTSDLNGMIVRSNGEMWMLKQDGTSERFAEGVMLPSATDESRFVEEAPSGRYDPATITYSAVRRFFDGRIETIVSVKGGSECAWADTNKVGLRASDGTMIFQVEWDEIQPLTEDRFVLNGRTLSGSAKTAILADRTGRKLNDLTFTSLFFYPVNGGTTYTGIAYVAEPPTGGQYAPTVYWYLVGIDGGLLSPERWSRLVYVSDGTFLATKDGVTVRLDFNGQVLP
jgi:hypothetical protein